MVSAKSATDDAAHPRASALALYFCLASPTGFEPVLPT